MASVWPAKNNYATGDVLTAANMNGIGDDLNDLYNSYSRAAGKNAIINGGMDIWQRGTSIVASGTGYSADRWQGYRSVAGCTISRQATGDTTNLPNIQYCARVQRDSGNTSTSVIDFAQTFETINSIPFAGKQVTFSYYARKGSNFSGTLSAVVKTGTGSDQNAITGFTGTSIITNTAIAGSLTTTWQRFTATATVDVTATQIAIVFDWTPSGTAGAADYFEITGVQLELGSSATPFSRAGGTIQGELAACQRYYWRSTGGGAYSPYGNGGTISTTGAYISVEFPTQMRTAPSSIDFSNIAVQTSGGTLAAISTLLIDQASLMNASLSAVTGSSWTANQPCRMINNNNIAGYVGLNAEL